MVPVRFNPVHESFKLAAMPELAQQPQYQQDRLIAPIISRLCRCALKDLYLK
jgi:hypothetical protein